MLLKIMGLSFGVLYLLFVVLQYNDPDPLIWMVAYGMAALACFMAAANKTAPAILWLAAALYIACAIFVWPARFEGIRIGGGDIKHIEEARESLGLLLCAVSFTCLALLQKYHVRRSSNA